MYTVINHERDNEKEFETKDDAQDALQEVISLGADPENVELVKPDNPPATTDDPEITSEKQFVQEIQGVPSEFAIELGDSYHIKKEGYYYLADKLDIEYGAEPIATSVECDGEKAVYRGWAERGEKRYENVGTAHKDGEDMQGSDYNLDELAATRAACRVLSMATGTGIASMEEMTHLDQ